MCLSANVTLALTLALCFCAYVCMRFGVLVVGIALTV